MVVDRQGGCGGDGETILSALLDKLSLTTVVATNIVIWVCWTGAGIVTYAFWFLFTCLPASVSKSLRPENYKHIKTIHLAKKFLSMKWC